MQCPLSDRRALPVLVQQEIIPKSVPLGYHAQLPCVSFFPAWMLERSTPDFLMRIACFVVACLLALPSFAKDAAYSNGVLKLDAVQVGADAYVAELVPVPNVTPLSFTLRSATKVAAQTSYAATYSGVTLTVPNVMINGATRASAKLTLTGSNPLRFQLSTYSVLRGVTLANPDETLKPGKAFYLNYTGGVLDSTRVKLTTGGNAVRATVMGNSIAGTVPIVTGSQTLEVDLDGDKFQLPITVQPSAMVSNPRPYVTGVVTELAAELKTFGLPSTLLDQTLITTELAKLSESDAQLVALMVRENISTLLAELDNLTGTGNPLLSASALSAASSTAGLDQCQRLLVYYMRAEGVVALAYGMAAGGAYAAGTGALTGVGAIVTAISVSAGIVAAELAARYQDQLLSFDCRQVRDATIASASPLHSEVYLTTHIEASENRARTIQVTELYQLYDLEVRNDYISTSTRLRNALQSAVAMLQKIGFSSTNSAIVSLNSLIGRIKTDDTLKRTDQAHKYTIRSITDSRISGSVVSTRPGTVTLLFDKKDEELPEGRSVSFSIELYNSTDDVSIFVPIKLNGVSLIDDLKEAVLGTWTVVRVDTPGNYKMVILAGGTGKYVIPTNAQNECPNGTKVGIDCEYKITWTVEKYKDRYIFVDRGFFHPAYHDPAITERSGLTLPLTGFTLYGTGHPESVGIRFWKD